LGFEVFVKCFKDGEPAGVPRSGIRSLFPIVEAKSELDYWFVWYDDLNSCHVSVTPLVSDLALVESLSVVRPCGDLRLWEALLAVMRFGSVVPYFPGDAHPMVASEAAGAQLPTDLVEALGRPRVVRSGQEIVEAVRNA
jgi:hypothetical protein